MEVDDDLYLVIVGLDGQIQNLPIRGDLLDKATNIGVEEIMKSVEMHGEHVNFDKIKIKEEAPEMEEEVLEEDFDADSDYVPDDEEKDEEDEEVDEVDEVDEDYDPTHCNTDTVKQSGRRYKMRKPWQRKSYINELKQQCPELKHNEKLLIETLSVALKSVKRPPPPKDYFIMTTDALYECVICGTITETNPAAWRHYQEKHGKRYLICFACGVDFRSTTNLYKHEKRCNAPDAVVLLKARARILGAKARNRPFVAPADKIKKPKKYYYHASKNAPYDCSLCPARFTSKTGLEAHMFMHEGVRPYRCMKCPAAYTSKSALGRHQAKHSDVLFVCDHCQRSFRAKAALVAHMDTHRPLKKYPCALCERRFAQKNALQLHVDKIHLNLPPPCACQICPRRFPRMSLLKRHMLREHGMSLMTRKMFFKSLPMMTDEKVQQVAKVILKSEVGDRTPNSFYDRKSEPIDYGPVECVDDQTIESQDLEGELMRYLQDCQTKGVMTEQGEIIQLNNGEIYFEEEMRGDDEDSDDENNVMYAVEIDKKGKVKTKRKVRVESPIDTAQTSVTVKLERYEDDEYDEYNQIESNDTEQAECETKYVYCEYDGDSELQDKVLNIEYDKDKSHKGSNRQY